MITGLLGGLLCALLLTAAAFVTSYRVAWALVGATSCALRYAAVLVIGMWFATVGFHLLLATGTFALWAAVPLSLLLALGSCRWIGRQPTSQLLGRDARVLRRVMSQPFTRPGVLALLALAPFVGARILRCLVQPSIGWDSLVYHLPRAALFVQEGAFTFDPAPGSWSLYRNVFAGGEVLWTWAMLPFGNDVLLSFSSSLPWLAVGLATWALARGLRVREPYASLSGALVLFIPTLQLEVPSGYVEPAGCAAVMVALAAAVCGARHDGRRLTGHLVLAAMSAGVAAGIKPPLSIAAVLACALLLALAARRAGSWFWIGSAAACAAALLPALPWAIHSWIDTGAPLSPMPLSLFGITLGKADPHLRLHLTGDISQAYTWAREWSVLREVFAMPLARVEGLGIFSAVPLVLAPFGIWRATRRNPRLGILLGLALLATCAFIYLPGFTRPRLYQSANVSRFVIVPILIAIPTSLLGLGAIPRLQRIYGVLLWSFGLFYAVSFVPHGAGALELRRAGLALAVMTAVGLPAWIALRRIRVRALRGLLVFGVAGALLCLLRQDQLEHRYEAAKTSFQVHPTPSYWVAAARAVDQREQVNRIAVTAGPSTRAAYWYAYYFMGSQLQNRLHYVPITADGEVAHFGARPARTELADRASWTRRLRERDVTHVVSFRPRSIEFEWMRAMPKRFRFIEGADDWGVFEVVKR